MRFCVSDAGGPIGPGRFSPGRQGSAHTGRISESDRRSGVPGPLQDAAEVPPRLRPRSRTRPRTRSRVVGDARDSCVHGPDGWRKPCFPGGVGDERGRRDTFLGGVRQCNLALGDPESGAVPSTASVSVDLSGLAAGTYNGTVTITSTGGTGSPKSIPVTLTVTAPPPGPLPQISLAVVADGFASPVHVTHCRGRERPDFRRGTGGRIRILDNGAVLPVPFLDLVSLIPPRIVAGGEQGLLSVAFPPGFASKGYFYVNYTSAPDGATVIARYRVSAGDANVARSRERGSDPDRPQPFANHNGGQLAFGPDGYLYIGMGDGGSGGDPLTTASPPAPCLENSCGSTSSPACNRTGSPRTTRFSSLAATFRRSGRRGCGTRGASPSTA